MWWKKFKLSQREMPITENTEHLYYTPEEVSPYLSDKNPIKNMPINKSYPLPELDKFQKKFNTFYSGEASKAGLERKFKNKLQNIKMLEHFINERIQTIKSKANDVKTYVFQNPPECLYCKQQIVLNNDKTVAIDHFIPNSIQSTVDIAKTEEIFSIAKQNDFLISFLKDAQLNITKNNFNWADKMCNIMKSDRLPGDFIEWCVKVAQYKPDLKLLIEKGNNFKKQNINQKQLTHTHNQMVESIRTWCFTVLNNPDYYKQIINFMLINKYSQIDFQAIEQLKNATDTSRDRRLIPLAIIQLCVQIFDKVGIFSKTNMNVFYNRDDTTMDYTKTMEFINIKHEITGRIMILQQSPCCICGEHLDTKFEIDHILPKSLYGDYAINPKNLIPIHAMCNRSKSDFSIADVRKRAGIIILNADINKQGSMLQIYKIILEELGIANNIENALINLQKESNEYKTLQNNFNISSIQKNIDDYKLQNTTDSYFNLSEYENLIKASNGKQITTS